MRTGETFALFAHLAPATVAVREGQDVPVGALIGPVAGR
jgi:hypothetical protein